MSDLLQKCAVCGALLDEEDLFCGNCGTEAPQTDDNVSPRPDFEAKFNFECQSCGASMSYDASAQTLRCPFCGSERLAEQKDMRILRPDGVVPFAIDQTEALARLRQWLGSSFWRPGDLAQAAEVTTLAKVYVPYWSFSARVFTYWTADTSNVPRGASGDWFPLFGENRGEYRGLLVGGSSVLMPAETTAICPFDLSAALPPEQVDLNKAVYEQFRVQRKYARPLAQAGLETEERQACTKFVSGNCRNLKVNVRAEELTGNPMLLPVWMLAYRYRGRLFRFLVNGQTGKCTGSAPISYSKIAAFVIAIMFAVIVAVCVLGILLSRRR